MIAASLELPALVRETASRHPCVGLAMGVAGRDGLETFHAEGLADIASHTPIDEDTAFRVASLTKTFTAIAVLQLHERGLVDLDAPAAGYLRAYRLVPARAGWRPATLRHLLTHTAGIRQLRHLADLRHLRDLGETVELGRPFPTLAEYYAGALRIEAEPGTRLTYSNHGFATLGQIVEDVTGQPVAAYLREHVFDPLGMERTDLELTERVGAHRAAPYELRRHGPEAVPDYRLITRAAGAAYSTPRDLGHFLAYLLGGHGTVLQPETRAMLFAPQFQPDPRLPGIGLAWFRVDLGGHPAVEHGGILPGFDAQLLLAPADGVGFLALANGAQRGMLWLAPVAASAMRELLGVPEDRIRDDLPQHPEIWAELCGRYRQEAGWSDPGMLMVGASARVGVSGGRLLVRPLSPIPGLHRGFVLHPDDEHDPYVFRIEIPRWGIGTGRVVFSRRPGHGTTGFHIGFENRSYTKVG